MKNNVDYSLYLCTDRNLMLCDTVEESVKLAIIGGTTIIQLREKDISSREFYDTALKVKAATQKHNIPLIINDRVDIALAVDADGVHVGQSDLECSVMRSIIGHDKIVGVSASSLNEAVKAEKDGADYIGVGAMYSTDTKNDADIVSMEELIKIRKAVKIPIVVIGGINKSTIPNFSGIGIDGIAVVSAIVSQADIAAAAKELKEIFNKSKH